MKSIGLKLWTWIMALIILIFILLWFFLIVFLDNFYISMRISDLKNQGYEIVNLYSNGNIQQAEDRIDKVSYENNASISLIDKSGNEIYTSNVLATNGFGMGMGMLRNNSVITATNQVLSGVESAQEMTHPRFGNKFYFIGIPIKSTQGMTGAIIINAPLAPVKDTVLILQKQLGIVTIIILIITVIFAYFLSKTFSKPILKITASAESISNGEYDTRIDIKSKDEIGKLSDTINNMAIGLSKVENLRRDFIANVSHELRTPLTIIRSYAETIKDVSGENSEKRNSHLDVIIEESQRLSIMVDDILNLSQIQSGNIVLNISKFEISEFLKVIAEKYAIIGQKKDIKINLESKTDKVVSADKERISQVLYNLINNSLNHTNAGGQITLSCYEIENVVRITVSDTGEGIAKEQLSSIWERYYKGQNKTGTGLGLSIVKGIFDAHGLKYGIESELYKGTSIWFELGI